MTADQVVHVLQAHRAGKGLAPVLVGLYGDAWLAGERAAADALTDVLGKDDRQHQAVVQPIDWAAWTPGSNLQAGLVYGDGLQALLTDAVGRDSDWADRAAERGSLIASIEDGRLDKLGSVLAEHLAAGSSVDTIERALADGILDTNTWADLVAVTETARAMTAASLVTYAAAGVRAKEFIVAGDDRTCIRCIDNEAEGAIPIGDQFPNGDPPVHPSCRCALVPASLSPAEATTPAADPATEETTE